MCTHGYTQSHTHRQTHRHKLDSLKVLNAITTKAVSRAEKPVAIELKIGFIWLVSHIIDITEELA